MTTEERKELFNKIIYTLTHGRGVQITTAYKSTLYKPKHVDMFRLTSDGRIQAQNGKKWEIVDLAQITAVIL